MALLVLMHSPPQPLNTHANSINFALCRFHQSVRSPPSGHYQKLTQREILGHVGDMEDIKSQAVGSQIRQIVATGRLRIGALAFGKFQE
jgi:hypothetical protein